MDKPEIVDIDSVDLRVYLKILQKWKWLIVGITLLAVVTSGALSFFILTPVYQSKTVIMAIQYQDPKAVQNNQQKDDLESVVGSLSRLPEMTIKTYVGQIKNEALLRNVIYTLKLDNTIYTPDSLSNLIDVKAVPETNLIELSVKNNDSNLAALIANTMAEKFLEFVGSANQKQLVISADFLTKQLAESNKELAETTNNLNKYRNDARNVAYLEQEAKNKNQNLTTYQNQMLQADADYQQALAGKTAAEEKLKNVPEKIMVKKIDVELGRPVETEEINPVYTELAQLAAQKSVELAELEARKQSFQTAVDQLQADIKNLQAELNSKRETDTQLQEKMEQIKKTRDVLAEKLTQVQIIKSINLSQTSLQIVTPAFPQIKP
ncbi:MAG: GumC family protein, partial [Eubacteriales bacterium]